jgi:hypothetical protein
MCTSSSESRIVIHDSELRVYRSLKSENDRDLQFPGHMDNISRSFLAAKTEVLFDGIGIESDDMQSGGEFNDFAFRCLK